MPEKCTESCPDLARLERQVKELQRQNGEDHKEIRDRLSKAEMTNAVQNERYDAILGKLEELSRKHDSLTRKSWRPNRGGVGRVWRKRRSGRYARR